MRVFRYVAHQYADDHFVHDLTQGVRHVGGQLMDGQKLCVLGGQSLGVFHDHCVVLMCVTCR
jgi:hypothetical protein